MSEPEPAGSPFHFPEEKHQRLLLHLHDVYKDAKKKEETARQRLQEGLNAYQALYTKTSEAQEEFLALEATYNDLVNKKWMLQLKHRSPDSISSNLYEKFTYGDITYYIDLGLIATAAANSSSIPQAFKLILLGHFTEDAIKNSTLCGYRGNISLFPDLLDNLIRLTQLEDICRRFQKNESSTEYLMTTVRTIKSNLLRQDKFNNMAKKKNKKSKIIDKNE